MPKIPTFEAQQRPTTQVPSVASQFQVPVEKAGSIFGTVAGGLDEASAYYAREQAIKDKTEATKNYLELDLELDKIQKGAIQNIDPSQATDTFQKQFEFLKKEKLSGIQNKAAAKLLEDKLNLEFVTRSVQVTKGSRDQLDLQFNNTWNSEYQLNMAKYTSTDDENEKQVYKSQMEQGIVSRNLYLNDGQIKLQEDLKKNNALLAGMDVDRLINKEKYDEAKSYLMDFEKSKDIDIKSRADFLDKIEKQSLEVNETKAYSDKIINGTNPFLAATPTKTTEKKVLQFTEKTLAQEANKQNLSEEQTFAYIDEAFSKSGLLSPTYQSTLKAGYNAGSITTFDKPSDLPKTLVQAVKVAESAQKTGRLNVYTTEEEERFYSNIVALKSVKGLDDYQAIKTAKEVQGKLNKNVIANFKSQQNKLQTQIDSDFTSSKFFGKNQTVANINEVQLYGEKLFNIYSAMNFSSTEAKDQVLEDLDKNIDQIDGYAYLKRDLNAFKSIGGVENVPKIKEYIVKNNLIKEENDPKDYFLRHNGAGQFEIRRRVDIAPVYDKNNNPMIFYAKDLFNIANQINIDVEKEAMQSALKAQEKMQGRKKQQAETGFGETGP
jgi:hypothetical protein